MENSHIEWTDHTFNPWIGCTKVSPGCAHCYAEARDIRFTGGIHWGKGAHRQRTSVQNWNEPLRWNRLQETSGAVHHGAARPRVFCASLADWLDDEVQIEWLADLLALIHETPHLDWLLLTKRPENWRAQIGNAAVALTARGVPHRLHHWQCGEAPANVWIGTTVEDQRRADERIPHLLRIPARVRFLSCEPLLGAVHFSDVTGRSDAVAQLGKKALTGVHWVIVGGESGAGARPMHPDWARSLRDQCDEAGVAFHFKQHGEWIARSQYLYVGNEPIVQAFGAGGKFTSAVMRRDGGIDESLGEASTTNDSDSAIVRVGKKLAGRLLDGVEHKAFPK